MGLKSFSAPFWVVNRSFLVIPEPLCQIDLPANSPVAPPSQVGGWGRTGQRGCQTQQQLRAGIGRVLTPP